MPPRIRLVSSLEKVFCRPELDADPLDGLSLLKGEVAAFQIAVRGDREALEVDCRVEAPFDVHARVRQVGLVPCLSPAMDEDPFVLTHEPGLFPAPLSPHEHPLTTVRGRWSAFWISVELPEDFAPGRHTLRVVVSWRVAWHHSTEIPEFDERVVELELDVVPAVLPPPELDVSLWFYADCLASRYGLACWSEEHWEAIDHYFRDLVEHGATTILTPLWTPPLDTDIGHERPTTQLLGVVRRAGDWSFDFSRLERWCDLAFSRGFRQLEFSHFCTQWGAEFTPKIVVETETGEEKTFGWHVRSDAPEYRGFLARLLPELTAWLKARGPRGRAAFHISDEPFAKHKERYADMARFLAPFLADFPVMDAISSPAFWREGLLDRPVPGIEHIDGFGDVPAGKRWLYYCGNWRDGLPNRQFGMPSARNRVFGLLLYLYDFDGFLNWGYNFWYSRLSRDTALDPWRDPDAGRGFCGGGSFLVFPGPGRRPVDGLHFEVFREALQDLRALRLLEKRIGRERTVAALHEGLGYRLTMTRYPREAAWLLETRARVNRLIASGGPD